MNLQKLTAKAQEAVQTALEIAQSNGNQAVEPPHLMKAFLQEARPAEKELDAQERTWLRMVEQEADVANWPLFRLRRKWRHLRGRA